MRGRTVNRTPIAALFLVFVADMILSSSAFGQQNDVAVIVNPKNPITNISLADLRKTFAGQRRSWPGGLAVKLIIQPAGSSERLAMLRLLSMSESEYKQYWTAQVFRGEVDAEPLTLPSFGMVKEAAKLFPGAIALVRAQDVKPGMDLKVIKVEGHMPGEAGYPLQ
jgi:hypothetical protein